MPPEGVPRLNHDDILRFEEIEAVVRVGVELGIRNVRLTGGEPLTRAGIVSLVQKLSAMTDLNDLAMTTNGALFSRLGPALLDAGLRRVNFGIPSLNPDTYSKITRIGSLGDAIDGLNTAIRLGFAPIKVNVVVMRGINEDLTDFVVLAKDNPIHLRFIEYMPIGDADYNSTFVPASEIRQRLNALTDLEPMAAPIGCGPDQNAQHIKNGKGSVAVIAPMTEHVCGNCNRLRLTADGKLRLCLFSKGEIDLKPALRPKVNSEMLKSLFVEAVCKKPKSLHEATGFGRRMSQIGG
jgi:cyclic pyranopterin phosphate synthase